MQRFEKLFGEKKFVEFINDYKSIEDKILAEDKLTLLPMLALAYFHTEQYAESMELHNMMCQTSKDVNLWFNLSTSAILNGEYERGTQALDQALEYYSEVSDEERGKIVPVPHMLLYTLYAFMDMKQYELAFDRLHQLASIYIQVRITDTQFLYARGIPSFNQFLEIAAGILPNQTKASPKDWLTALSERVDEEGAALIEELKTKI